jgi:hypothetical protein
MSKIEGIFSGAGLKAKQLSTFYLNMSGICHRSTTLQVLGSSSGCSSRLRSFISRKVSPRLSRREVFA